MIRNLLVYWYSSCWWRFMMRFGDQKWVRWNQPMHPYEVERAKGRFEMLHSTHHSSATCADCRLQRVNQCSLQFDSYNTNGDCLLSK